MRHIHIHPTHRPLLSTAIAAVKAVNAANVLRIAFVAALAATPLIARAAPYTSDTAGNWNTNTNWSPDFGTVGQGPRVGAVGGDSATLLHAMTYGGGGTGGASGDFTISNGNSVTIGNSTTVGSFNQTGASGSWIRIGDAGTGTLNIVNGSFIANQAPNLSVGSNGATGIINVGDSVGAAGQAVLNLQTNNREMNLGQNISSVGVGHVTVNSDGIIEGGAATIRIGQGSNATTSTLTVNAGGTFNVRETLEVGANGGANGQLTSAGTIAQSAGTFTIGWDGTGAATFTGGTYTHTGGGQTVDGQVNTTIIIGRNDGAGTLNISGGTVTTTQRLVTGANEGNDGNPAEGVISLSGSGILNVGRAHLGYKGDNTANRSTVMMSGTSQFNSNEWIAIGEFTRSEVTLNNSAAMKFAVTGGASMAIGAGNGGIGVVTLNDNASLSAATSGTLDVGNNSGSTGTLTINNSATVTVSTLNVGTNVGSTGTVNLNGGTLTIGSGGIGGSGTANINLGGGTVAASATWSSARNMSLTGSGGNTTFDTNGNNISLTGNLTGAGGLIKVDNGMLTLSGANAYAGITTINGGTVSVDSDGRLGTAPGVYVANQLTLNGGTLRVTATADTSFNSNRGVTLGASGGTIDNSPTSNSFRTHIDGRITGTGSLTLYANGDTSDSGGGSPGFLNLANGTNDFVGGISINSGVVAFSGGDAAFGNAANVITINNLSGLVADGNRTLNHNIALAGGGDKIFRAYGGTTFTVNGTISGTGNVRHTDGGTLQLNGNLTFTGNLHNVRGTLGLGGASNTYTGYTFVDSNTTLRLDANHVIPDTSDILQYGNTTVNINGKTETIRSIMVGSNADTNATLNVNGGSLTVLRGSGSSGSLNNAGSNYYAKITGTGAIDYNNTVVNNEVWDWLNTANDFNGSITITGGRLRFNGDASIGNAANDLTFNGAPTASLANQAGTASVQVTNGTNLNLGAGRDIILNAGKEGTMYVWGGTTMTVNGIVTGAGDLRKEDTGILLLNNSGNNYGGKTTIVLGDIRLGANEVLPNGTTVQIGGTSGGNPNLDLNGKTETIAGLNDGGQTNGRVTGNGGSLTVSGSGTYAFGGNIQDGFGATTFNKTGSGTQTLSGANTYAGATNVNAGELIVDGTHTGGGLYTVVSGARLGGNGTIGANVDVAGTPGELSPGNKGSMPSGPFPGGSSTASFSYSAGTDIDTVGALEVSGNVDLGGHLLLDVMNAGHDMLNIGSTFTIDNGPPNNALLEINGTTDFTQIDFWGVLGWTNVGSSIDLVTYNSFGGGEFANIAFNTQFADAGGRNVLLGLDGDSIFLTAVPEPGSIALWSLIGLIGVSAFGLRAARRRNIT